MSASIYHDRLVGDVVRVNGVYYVVINSMETNPVLLLINPLTGDVKRESYTRIEFTGKSYDIDLVGLNAYITTGKGYKIDVRNKCMING